MNYELSKKGKGGFTLVELLVSISIIVVITAVVFLQGGQFNNTILLNNLAYEMALTVREAQVYGVSVKETNTNSFDASYGVYFETANNKSFISFADINKDGWYDSPEMFASSNIKQGNYISDLCVYDSSGVCVSTNQLAIIFQRPDPDAIILTSAGGTPYSGADITVSSPSGNKKVIKVTSVGQISVQ